MSQQVDLDEVLSFVRETVTLKKTELEKMIQYPEGTNVAKLKRECILLDVLEQHFRPSAHIVARPGSGSMYGNQW